jgi:hypothetical protein
MSIRLHILFLFLGRGSVFSLDISLVVPFAVEEMRELSQTHVNEFLEESGDHGRVVDLEIHAGVSGETQQLCQHVAGALDEDRVYHRVDETRVRFPFVLIQQYSVLNMEVGLIEVQIDVFGQNESADDLIIDFGDKGQVPGVGVDSGLLNAGEDGVPIVEVLEELFDLVEVALLSPLHEHVLLNQRVSVQNVQHVGECVFRPLVHQCELLQQRILSDSVWLSDNEIVSVWVEFEGVFEEVFGLGVKGGFHAEQRDCEGVLRLVGGHRNCIQVLDLLHDLVVHVVGRVGRVLLFFYFEFSLRNGAHSSSNVLSLFEQFGPLLLDIGHHDPQIAEYEIVIDHLVDAGEQVVDGGLI